MSKLGMWVAGPVLMAAVLAGQAAGLCTGDCGHDGSVTVNEMITGVNIALGNSSSGQCAAFDRSGDGQVTVNELVEAVGNALMGCPFTGQYTAMVDIGDGDIAIIHLQVAPDGSASGTLSAAEAAQAQAAFRLTIPFLTLTGSVDLDSGAYHLSGSFQGPDGQVPIDVSGSLPERLGVSGTIDLDIGPDNFSGDIVAGEGSVSTPTPTRTAIPGTPSPTPNGESCDGSGVITMTFSNVHDTNATTTSPLVLGMVAAEDAPENGKFRWNLVGHQCFTGDPNALGRSISLGGFVNHPLAVGSYSLSTFGNPLLMIYGEIGGGIPGVGQNWVTKSGTFVVDSIDGEAVTFHLNASMQPLPGPLGANAHGTFDIAFSGRVEHWQSGGNDPTPTPTMAEAIVPDPRLAGIWSGTADNHAGTMKPARLQIELDGAAAFITDLGGNLFAFGPSTVEAHAEGLPTALTFICDVGPCGGANPIIVLNLTLLPNGRLAGAYNLLASGTAGQQFGLLLDKE